MKKRIAFVLAAVIILAALSMGPLGVLAAPAEPVQPQPADDISVEFTNASFAVTQAQAIVTFTISNNRAAAITDIQIQAASWRSGVLNPSIDPISWQDTIEADRYGMFTVQASGNQLVGHAGGTYPAELVVSYKLNGEDKKINRIFSLVFEPLPTPTPPPDPTAVPTPVPTPEFFTPPPPPTPNPRGLYMDTVTLDGRKVDAPTTNYGDMVRLVLPLRARNVLLTNIEVTPVISSKLEEFPFDITNQTYTRTLPSMMPGAKADLVWDFRVSKLATAGVKVIAFNAVYEQYGQITETKFTVYLTVIKGAAETPVPGSSAVPVSVPKLIISQYSFEPEQIFAGEEFQLHLAFTNTSAEYDVRNVKITIKNEEGVIIPSASGSNTIYVPSVGRQQETAHTLTLKAQPDAAVKSYPLAVTMEYENEDANPFTSNETLAIPVMQRTRVRLDDPVVMGDVMVGASAYVRANLINMGKSTLYNCMFTVEGDGMHVEEGSYFAGNVAAGSGMNADLNVVADQGGELRGKLVVTYEDAYGNESREERDLTINAIDAGGMDGMGMDEAMIDPATGMPYPIDPETGLPILPGQEQGGGLEIWQYAVAGGGALVIALAVLLLLLRRAKRAKEYVAE